MPVCHLHSEMSQLWAHGDMCLPSEKDTGDSRMIKWIGRAALWPITGPVTGGMRAGPEEDEPAAALGKAPSHSLFLLRPREQRSHKPPSLTFPAGLFSSLSMRDSAPSPHVVTSGCMHQRILIKMCACIYVQVHAYMSTWRCL